MRILIACEYSGIARDAFIAKGHDVLSCDLEPTEKPGPHYQGDVFDIISDGWDMMIAHPPCTRLANSGVRWLHKPPRGKSLEQIWKELEEGAEFYKKLRDVNIPRKAIENPIMHKYARERIEPRARQVVQPWWFGDKAFKATGFELYGLPMLKETDRLEPPLPGTDEHKVWSKCHRESPGPERWKNRSRTYPGVANAMAQQWG